MLVSVIIPTFNRAATIARSIESVLTQTYQNLELIVVDDGSTDNTHEVLAQFQGRIQLVEQPNSGPSAARNKGVERSRGAIIAFQDSDDVWLPEKLERQVEVLERGGEGVSCCVCNARYLHAARGRDRSFENVGIAIGDRSGYLLNPSQIIATRFFLFNQVVAIRREAFTKIGGFNEQLWLLEDSDLALRLSLLGPWGMIGTPLVAKYDDTEGLGVTAMRNGPLRATRWKEVLAGFLNEHEIRDDKTRALLRWADADVKADLRASELAGSGSNSKALLGKLRLWALRMRRAAMRRSPLWPRIQIVDQISGEVDGGDRSRHV